MSRLLGTPPDQITEEEKTLRLAAIREKQSRTFEEEKKEGGEGWLDQHCELEAEAVQIEEKYPDLPPESGPITVVEISNTGSVCPTQFEGKSVDNKEVYARFRWGCLQVWVDKKVVFCKQLNDGRDEDHSLEYYKGMYDDEERAKQMLESHEYLKKFSGGVLSYKGHLSYEELVKATEGWFVWPEACQNGTVS